MLDKQGKYNMNPQVGRAMERARASIKKALPAAEPRAKENGLGTGKSLAGEEHKPLHHIEYHPHPTEHGRIMSHAHSHDGGVEEAEHADAHEAAEHLREHGSDISDYPDEEAGEDNGAEAGEGEDDEDEE